MSRTPLLCILGSLCLILLSCGGRHSGEGANAEQRSITYSLAKYFPVAQPHRPFLEIGMETDSLTRRLLSSGWYNPELDPEDEEWFRWTRDRNALVEIPVVSPSQLTLRLDVAPHEESPICPSRHCGSSGTTTISARSRWNGNANRSNSKSRPRFSFTG